ncbi:transposable element tc3 transposase [Caerostris extrusa]|uniref:Transposable element tc3 transposase n=1 Tax=Caerostris extrusa TaxID=172846 RepID=A0AAV4MP21_CAEEX|nr:transposable element tc3 transposase [Caerostris extrusa]
MLQTTPDYAKQVIQKEATAAGNCSRSLYREILSIVEKALLVKLYYKNSESAIARIASISLHERYARDSKGPITSSALKKMMKKFEATGSLASRQRSGRPSTAAAVATTVEQTVQSMSAVAAHGECSLPEVWRQTGVSYGSV